MGPKPKQVLSKEENELLSRFGIKQNLQIVIKKLQLKQLLQAHKNTSKFNIKVWACSKCNYFSNKSSNFNAHKRVHSKERPFKCPICKYSASRKDLLKSHMETHARSTRSIPCPFCSYMSVTSTLLNLHLRRHTGEKPYKCPQCEYQSATSCNLTRHVNRIHKKIILPQKSICQLCSKSFAEKSQLDAHILRHTGERPYSCQHCKKGFTRSAKNRRHENICKMNPQQRDPTWVASQNSFKCNLCEYSARENYQLKSHLQKHVMSKRFKCAYEYCDYQTSCSGNLRRHEGYHTSSRPFKCSACRLSCVSRSDLKSHMSACQRRQESLKAGQGTTYNLATDIPRPFKCDFHNCNVAFKNKGGLTQHVSFVHSRYRPFKCPVSSCVKSFTQKNKLQLHITSHSRI